MTPEQVAEVCQQWLAHLQGREKGTATFHHAERLFASFRMENRRNADRIAQVDAFFQAQGIALLHRGEVRASLWEFNREEPVTLRLVSQHKAFRQAGKAQVAYEHAGTIEVLPQASGIQLYAHQQDAMRQLNKQLGEARPGPFAGLLVLPTGGGKTLTAAYWLAKNLLAKNRKILWIAHRHELLDQAKDTFHKRLAFQDILPQRASFTYSLLSGIHDRPVNIRPTDDLLIASKDSISGLGFTYLRDQWLRGQEEVFLVIDEAHHATARTYRQLIANLQGSVKQLRLLGLTATPFRTVQEEQGLLAKVFPDDIVYKVDLRTLISRGILSKPVFEQVNTEVDLGSLLTEQQLADIRYFDISSIGEATARTIAENKDRNRSIVNRYLQHRARYRQTLVFALNQDNAIALKKLFELQGVRCDYVLSAIRDQGTGGTISGRHNKELIQRFRDQELEVLINVNILTEGTDLPNVQTVFLARPTISTTLMTQMIGRGLRGEKAGGTPEAYLVSFLDDWQDQIAWVNPEKLFIEENTDFGDPQRTTRQGLAKIISISKIEEFARLTDAAIDHDTRQVLESLDFAERLPLGIYHFVLLTPYAEEAREKNCEILVYNNVQQPYREFLAALPQLLPQQAATGDYLPDEQLTLLADAVEQEFFHGHDLYPGYRTQDVRDVLQYYYQRGAAPSYVAWEDRANFDISAVARHIWDEDLSMRQKEAYLSQLWQENQTGWQVFFGQQEQYFLHEIDLALRRLQHPHLYQRPTALPTDVKEQRRLEEMSMADIREHHPRYWRHLSDQVFAQHRDAEGYYVSPASGYRSKSKRDFQIDHIKALSRGGLTVLENLQLLTRRENGLKGNS